MFGPALLALSFLLASPTPQTLELPVQRVPGDRKLTPADEAELARLIATYGKPWLVFEPETGQMSGSWHLRVWLQPAEPGATIRRGKVLSIRTQATPGDSDLQGWRVSVANYAQVPIERTAVLTRSSTDLPFVERQRIPDANLLSLAAFVRNCPCRPESGGAPLGGELNGKGPITSVSLGSDGAIEVGVQREKWSGWTLVFQKRSDDWRLIAIRFVIA